MVWIYFNMFILNSSGVLFRADSTLGRGWGLCNKHLPHHEHARVSSLGDVRKLIVIKGFEDEKHCV